RDSCSAASLRLACQAMAQNMAAISGTSVSSAPGSAPRATSAPMAAAVVAMTTPSTHSVGLGAQVRNPYTSVKLIQMTWKGMVSQPGNVRIAIRLMTEKATHPASSSTGRKGQSSLMANRPSPLSRTVNRPSPDRRGPARPEWPASVAGELIAFTAHRLDQVESELRPQPPDTHVDDIRARVEVVSPHGRQQLPLGHRLAGMFRQLP